MLVSLKLEWVSSQFLSVCIVLETFWEDLLMGNVQGLHYVVPAMLCVLHVQLVLTKLRVDNLWWILHYHYVQQSAVQLW